jgi:hypothetical protein
MILLVIGSAHHQGLRHGLKDMPMQTFLAHGPGAALPVPVLPGAPRPDVECTIWCCASPPRTARAMNSGPVSLRMNWGAPYMVTRRSRTAITRGDGNEGATSRASPSRVNASMTVYTFRGVPLTQ